MTEDNGEKISTPDQIWQLIRTADNFLKYGDDARARERARKRFLEALAAAEAAGIEPMVQQIKLRLDDLDELDRRDSGPG